MNKFYLNKRKLPVVVASLVCGTFFVPGRTYASYSPGAAMAVQQQQTITGTVRDAATGQLLAGATVGIKGIARTTSTNAKGEFSLAAPDNATSLVVSFIGYVTQEVPLAGKTQVAVALQASATDLTQVVVVGYGTQQKKDVTGSVKSLKAEAFNKGIINAPQELLQGKMAGVNVTSVSGEPGGLLGVTVRGPGGIRTGSTPLFVIDGLPLDNASTGGGDPLNSINPQDIESMDVLKDASATAIYGARGANGVILITTKKGKAGASTLQLSSNIGFSKIARALPVLTASEFRTEVPKLGGTLDDKGGNTDWQKEVFRTAFTQNHNVALSGGTNKLVYYASFGMQRQEGIMKNNEMTRYTGRFNATQKFWDNDRLVVDVNLGVTNTKNLRPPITSVIGDALANNPTYPAYGPDGQWAKYQNMNNPLMYFDLDYELGNITRITGNISPSLRIIKGLVYKLNFGIDHSSSNRDIVSKANAVPQRDGRLETWNNYNRNTLIENYFTYNYESGVHNISALAGHSYQKLFIQGRNTSINKFPIGPIDPIYNPGLGQELTMGSNKPGGYALENELQSFFGRVTYQYDSRYLATINFRMDGSSKFGSNNKYGYFPSFSLGWRVSEEPFLKGSSVVSNLKLRAGWGQTGNQEIPAKITQANYTSQVGGGFSYPLYPSGPAIPGTVFARFPNPDIQWEVSKQTDLGVDFGFLNGALSGTIDYFHKTSSNILLNVVVADPVSPTETYWTNVKDMTITNKGLEIDLEYRKTFSSGLGFHVGGNITFIDNIVKKSPFKVIPSGSATGAGLTSATINGYVNGEPIGTFFLKEWTGFDANGLSTYADTNKDGVVSDEDRIAAGTALPNKMYSFSGGVNYKGFDLMLNFNGVSGNKIYDNTANANFYKLRLSKNVNTTREALQYPEESVNNAAPVSTRYLKDGAFLRLNNVTLGYNFNTRALGINNFVNSLRLSVTGQNLWVATKYDGYDPEVNTDKQIGGVYSYGIDFMSYPKAKSVLFSLNVSF